MFLLSCGNPIVGFDAFYTAALVRITSFKYFQCRHSSVVAGYESSLNIKVKVGKPLAP
jgi:hypothetical protein